MQADGAFSPSSQINEPPVLEVEHLTIDFFTERGVIHAVRDVSFSLRAGETLALVGESGCGKSVICKSIPGILHSRGKITGGCIRYRGQEISNLTEKQLRAIRGKEIGMVFQNPMTVFDPTVTVGRQIAEAVLAHGEKCSKKQALKRAEELLAMVEIERPEERVHQYPHEFSGGMLQRAAIACALAASPGLLIADEPTTALDATVQKQILSLLISLQKKAGIAILFVTHDLSVVAQIAHRVTVLYAGKVVETGTVQEIFYDPRHPYTWGLFASLPCAEGQTSVPMPGTAPDMLHPPQGDAFAPRNRFALEIDYKEQPPLFYLGGTHYAATWLAHPNAPEIKPPVHIQNGRILVDDVYGTNGEHTEA